MCNREEIVNMTPDKLLYHLCSINEGTPYKGTITAPSNGEDLSVSGDVIFQLNKGRLEFEFFLESRYGHFSRIPYQIAALNWGDNAEITLEVASQQFKYRVRIDGLPGITIVSGQPLDREKFKGSVDTDYYGYATTDLSAATLYIKGLPDGIWGTDNTFYRYGVVKDIEEKPGSIRIINGLNLSGGGWTVNLQEIPEERRTHGVASHICFITHEDGSFNGSQVKEMLKSDLYPFLSLVFGQYIRCSMVEGHNPTRNYPSTPWGIIYPHQLEGVRTRRRNWFLISRGERNISSLFENYCSLPADVKGHFHKVIDEYIVSEEVLATLGRFEQATAISFAGLEGLVRSVISRYHDSSEWLKKDLSLKGGKNKGIKNAIKLVINRELGNINQLDSILNATYAIRNATVHTDLNSLEGEPHEMLYRWEACQFLIEAILLSQLGLREIPNRTQRGQFKILGKDMFTEAKDYEVRQVMEESEEPELQAAPVSDDPKRLKSILDEMDVEDYLRNRSR